MLNVGHATIVVSGIKEQLFFLSDVVLGVSPVPFLEIAFVEVRMRLFSWKTSSACDRMPENLHKLTLPQADQDSTTIPRHSMYAIYAYIRVVWGVNDMAVPWSVWDIFTTCFLGFLLSLGPPYSFASC